MDELRHHTHGSPDPLATDLATVSDILRRLRSRVVRIKELLVIIMSENDDLSTDLDELQGVVTATATAIGDLRKANADLTAQLAAGTPGLTAEQGAAIKARFQTIEQQLVDAVTPAGITVPPAQ